MAQYEDDIQSLVSRLWITAQGLIAQDAFMPFGASISQHGELAVEYVPPAASGLETRKALHRKLAQIARSKQARAVAICHSLENQTGAYLVISTDHAQDKPVTFLYPIQQVNGKEQVADKPIVQQAAYTFFGYVEPATALRLLPGTWVKDTASGGTPDIVTYRSNKSFERAGQTGSWTADEGDFYTNLIELVRGSNAPSRVARIIELSQDRVVLHTVSAGIVTASTYRRSK